MIRHAADAPGGHVIFAGDSAHEGPKAFARLFRDEGRSAFRAEDVVDVNRRVGVRHG